MQHKYQLGKIKMDTLLAAIMLQYGHSKGKPTNKKLKAYTLWCKGLSFEEICSVLSELPLSWTKAVCTMDSRVE